MKSKRVTYYPESDEEDDDEEIITSYEKTYTFINAAIIVLRDEKKFMTCKNIFKKIESRKLVKTEGLTPMNTLSAILHRYSYSKERVKKRNGKFGLRCWK